MTALFPVIEAPTCWDHDFLPSKQSKCISSSLLKAGGGFINLSSGHLLPNAIVFAHLAQVST